MSEPAKRVDKPPRLRELSWNRKVVLLALLQLALGLAYLVEVPRLMNDEAFESSLGHSLAFEGRIRTQVMMDCGGMDVHLVQNRLILPIVLSVIYSVMGFSIAASRFGSVLMSVLATVSICGVMRRWCGAKQSIWIGAAMILHPWFFEVSRRTRPEIYSTAIGMASLWSLTWLLDRRTRRAGVVTGVVAGLTCLVHPNGCVLLLAMAGAMVLFQRDREMWRQCRWLLLGFTVVIAPYVVYVLWSVQDPHVSFIGQMQACRDVSIEQRSVEPRWRKFVAGHNSSDGRSALPSPPSSVRA